MSERTIKDEGFTDPALRCDSCNKIVLKGTITALGLCNHCGNKRFRPVDTVNNNEICQIVNMPGGEEFISLFHDEAAMCRWKRSILFRKYTTDRGNNEK